MRAFKLLMAAIVLAAPVFASIPAHPGMLNYVEGQANINGQAVTNQSVGNADVQTGQVIETGQGKAEILLTPGVFLRLASNSAVRMINLGLADTTVEVLRGEAMVEATDIQRGNNIKIIDHGVSTRLDKNGLYSFKAEQPEVAVYDGQATVTNGGQNRDLKKGKEEDLGDQQIAKFDTKQGDELYRWSDLRSEYLSEASVSSARNYVVGPGWYGGGWYWNSWYGYYSFLPGDGFLYSPFGWGFYGPRGVGYYRGPVRGGAFVANRSFAAAPHAAFAGRAGGFHGGHR
jgi:hypothetical protein